MNTVLVFKTSVTKVDEIQQLSPHLNKLIPPNGKWNFDLEDCDRILRIESSRVIIASVMALMKSYNHLCDELE